MPTEKQKSALEDLRRALGMTPEQWTTKFNDLSDQQLGSLADGVLAQPVFHKRMNELDQQLKNKDAEVEKAKAELQNQYSAEINYLGQLSQSIQSSAGQNQHVVAAYQAKLNEIKQNFGLSDDQVKVDVQGAGYGQQFNQYGQPYPQGAANQGQYQMGYQPPNQVPVGYQNQNGNLNVNGNAQPPFITQADLQKALADQQAQTGNMLVGALSRQHKFFTEFNEHLDVEKVVAYANNHSVDIDQAINDVYDVQSRREAKQKADVEAQIKAAVETERAKWQQEHASDGLFAPNSGQIPSVANGQPSMWDAGKKENEAAIAAGQSNVNVLDNARLAGQMSRAQQVLASLNGGQ